jgi:hypothetical protein
MMRDNSFHDRFLQDRGFHDRNPPDQSVWVNYAQAMELTFEGNRLIAREIAAGAGRLWRGVKLRLGGTARLQRQDLHLPPGQSRHPNP